MKDVEYLYYIGKKVEKLESEIFHLKDFRAEFIKKKNYKLNDLTFDLDVSYLAKYFNKSYENMRLLKKKYLSSMDDTEQWALYCKSYYFDKELKNKRNK